MATQQKRFTVRLNSDLHREIRLWVANKQTTLQRFFLEAACEHLGLGGKQTAAILKNHEATGK